MICRKLETDDDKMKYRFLINYTECADKEETKKKKKTKGNYNFIARKKTITKRSIIF